MILKYTCTSCKQRNRFKPKMHSRADLQMKFGDKVKVNCKNCGKVDKVHLNKINAVVDNRLVVGGFIGGLILVVLFFVVGGIFAERGLSTWKIIAASASALVGIPTYLWNLENKAVGNFNRYAIKR